MKSNYAERGDLARDKITGYQGIVIATSQHITGCDRVSIQAPAGADGKLPDAYSFDITTVEVIEKGKVQPMEDPRLPAPVPVAKAGGPPTKATRL